MNSSPSTLHQRVSRRLQRQLENYFGARGIGDVFDAPVDLILTPNDVFVPDLVVAARPEDISRRGIEAPPLLVVEILSPSNRSHDRDLKAKRYAELGVRHLWIVDPELQSVACRRLHMGAFSEIVRSGRAVELRHPDFDGLVVDLAAIWRAS